MWPQEVVVVKRRTEDRQTAERVAEDAGRHEQVGEQDEVAQRRGRLESALSAGNASARLRAALQAGTAPEPGDAEVLVRRCGVEPDFFVRDMLTWSLTRHPAEAVLPLLLAELGSAVAQARSQALHTLSKIGDPQAWPALTAALLTDADDEVARAAWRTAVALAPAAERPQLAWVLAGQLGRGDQDVQRSLSRALVELGGAAEAAVRRAAETGAVHGSAGVVPQAQDRDRVRTHALATEALRRDPELDFAAAVEEAKRVSVMGVRTSAAGMEDGDPE